MEKFKLKNFYKQKMYIKNGNEDTGNPAGGQDQVDYDINRIALAASGCGVKKKTTL